MGSLSSVLSCQPFNGWSPEQGQKSWEMGIMRLVGYLILISICAMSNARAGDKGVEMSQAVLFSAGQEGCHTYRIPALAVTPKGTLLAFCEARRDARHDWGNIDLVMRRSLDHGATWEPIQVILDDEGHTCGNPCPIVDKRNGSIVLLITKNKGMENEAQIMRGEAAPRTVWVTFSRDEGLTWSTPREISSQVRQPDWRWYATGPCHGIQLKDGRLMAPCDHSTGPDRDEMHSHVIFSDDGGETWKIGGSLEGQTDESTIVELEDGSIYINARNTFGNHRRVQSVSRDRGMTWSPVAEDPVLVEPVCQASVLSLTGGLSRGRSGIFFSNPASHKRENLTVRLSYDECRSWPISGILWTGPAAYSDLVVTQNGMIGCLFERGYQHPYETITFARFTPAWLEGKTGQ